MKSSRSVGSSVDDIKKNEHDHPKLLQFKDLSLFAKPLRVGSTSGLNGDVITFTGLYAQFVGPGIRLASLIRSFGIGSCCTGANSGVLGISGVELRLSPELLSESLELLELELELL